MKYACCKSTADGASGAVVCTKCKQNFHLACLYPTDKKKIISAELKQIWVCPDCSVNQPRSAKSDNTPVRGSQTGSRPQPSDRENVNHRRGGSRSDSPPVSSPLESSHAMLVSIDTVKSFIASEMAVMRSELRKAISEAIARELKPIREEIASIRESMEFINNQQEAMTKRVDNLEKDIKSIGNVKSDIGAIKESIASHENGNDKREQWARRSNIEIFGVPERKGENLMNVLRDIAGHAQFPLDPSKDIDFVTRVAPKSSDRKTKPIVVRFLARWKKDEFLATVKKLRLKSTDIKISGDSFIYFNDHLTSTNKALLQRVKAICKEKSYKYVWVKHCAIKVRRSDTSPVINISHESDLNKIK
ncbi:uncharacterized protein LOC114357236 [Ostrinia furnacalis]|uniref:uncharacterized protein LOC114357236 n=1 Tax=Ostrinia furnacalis TaxID=93504 RepID=UPI00103C5292|nr:uncharacterized protein LOC114357236 [Ostrinia furnacalis]